MSRAIRSIGALMLAACLAIWVLWQAQRLVRADWHSVAARDQVVDWVSGAKPAPAEADWQSALADLEAARAITPDDPDLVESLGDLHTVAGQRDWNDRPRRIAQFRAAADLYRIAVDLRPTEAKTWARLAAAAQAAGEDGARVHDAWSRALAAGPYEGTVQPVLMQVVLSDWPGASKPMQDWADGLYQRSNEGTRRDINVLAARYGLEFVPDPPAPLR